MESLKFVLTFWPQIQNINGYKTRIYAKMHTSKSTFRSWYLKCALIMAPLVGLEPTTCGLTVRRSTDWAKEALCWHYLFSRPVTRQLSSAYMCLTSVFGMGTGGPTWQSTRTLYWKRCSPSYNLLPIADFCYSPHAASGLYQTFSSLSTTILKMVTHTGFEPMLTAWEAAVLTTWPMGHLVHLQGL